MSYIKSSNIEVFPVAKKRSNDAPGTRVFTEKNVSNLSRQLLSNNPGYIISCEANKSNSSNFDIAFNLYGYYFNITDFSPVSVGESEVYASIVIKDDEIFGQDTKDEGGNYTGLNLTSSTPSTPSSGELKYIKLFEKVSGVWGCPRQNMGLLSALVIGGIDGKHS